MKLYEDSGIEFPLSEKQKTVMKKIVYIAHPIGGDIEANLKDLFRILRIINMNLQPKDPIIAKWEFEDIHPVAPYVADIYSLDDNRPLERRRGIDNDIALILTGIFKELWLTGNKISFGMEEEVKLFRAMGKPIINYIGKI